MATGQGDRTGRRVGELAAATGLTVRTLHYYEEIGLLVPSARTYAGHRLYDDADVARLYRICVLRRLGLPLVEIGRALEEPAWNLRAAMTAHLGELDRRLEAMGRLRSRLAGLLGSIGTGDSRLTHDLLTTVEEMTMLDTAVQGRIMLLVYEDIGAAHDWLVRVFGLGPGRVDRNDEGRAVHAELQAGDGVIWLHQEQDDWGLGSPQSVGAATACVAVMVDDVDAHYRHAVSEGASVVHEPVDQPYGYREYSARDLEGHLWSFMKPLD
ncbi:MerR family transcriptional regulator [Phytoactinopolyspora mesophila]|uniref:MerR family transcriptional regulator n=1 Tax=Phytoactinopolyspora mesophila TaxID=2650750 RepID=A0A7K3M459_9ACTN|nr:MerR family transcriptional regulator [Phytoactinopolyspora mesophila]NDL58035.1 MerR family transcriptional regulator [Phytoactinopolyspora mesophila]